MWLTLLALQIAFSNIAIIRTMQAKTERNIMTELGFTADRYNLLATVQGVRKSYTPRKPIPDTNGFFSPDFIYYL